MDKGSRIKEIIVVEGRDDTNAIKRSVDAETIETHGYGISAETWQRLSRAYETKGLIIFTDPDPAGERIRRTLTERFPKATHAFLDRTDAEKNGDIGIENADPETIKIALENAHAQAQVTGDALTMRDMDAWGLAGSENASERRRELGKKLGVGFAGAKTFLRRLNAFDISREEIEEAIDWRSVER